MKNVEFLDINDNKLRDCKTKFIAELAKSFKEEAEDMVNIPLENWEKIVEFRAGEGKSLPLTLVAVKQQGKDYELIGAYTFKKGCEFCGEDKNYWMGGMFVNPKFRNQGFCRQLVEKMIDKIRLMGIKEELHVYVAKPELQKISKSCGMKVYGKGLFCGYETIFLKATVDEIYQTIHSHDQAA